MSPAAGLALALLAVGGPLAALLLWPSDPGDAALRNARAAVAAEFASPEGVRLASAVVYRRPDGSEVVCGVASAPNPLTGLRIERSFYVQHGRAWMPPEPGEYAFDALLRGWSEDYDKACVGEVIAAGG
jgi:hypothetical protein